MHRPHTAPSAGLRPEYAFLAASAFLAQVAPARAAEVVDSDDVDSAVDAVIGAIKVRAGL